MHSRNIDIEPHGDIRKIKVGVPCQPFSKDGEQNGFQEEKSGNLVYRILKVLRYHKPNSLTVDNVPTLQNMRG
ncbi:DNA cytosine methyltransferase [Paenibacillus sp. NFR01]|uniref:DNA cytosine methyltransferase n=1 Tax=Paenibacillus sp. NFR01 TaxID=1566279 RepID=UPI001587D658